MLNHLLSSRGLRQFPHRNHIRSAFDQFFNAKTQFLQVNVHILQNIGRYAASFLDQTQKNVLRTNIFMIETLSFLVGQGHYLSRSIRKSLKHTCSSFLS